MTDSGDTPYSAGFSRITVGDRATGERITAGVWYPTQSREARVSEQSRTFLVARDTMPAPGSYPLVLLSHGSGAWYGAHHDSAEHLARHGFVIASVTHPGDNFEDLGGYLGAQQLLGRPHHMKLLEGYLLGTHKYGSIVDTERLAAMGFAEGAYAVTVLMGGRPDFERFADHARLNPNDPILLPHWELTVNTLREQQQPEYEVPIVSAVLMAPAFGFLFDRDRLSRVPAQARIYRAEMDKILRADTHVEPYLRSLPRIPEYRIVKGAGHYAFLSPCPEALIEEDPDICRDRPGFDRVAFHTRLNDQILDYFNRTLDVQDALTPYGLEPAVG
jgi:predicted dienelactone hydrolase